MMIKHGMKRGIPWDSFWLPPHRCSGVSCQQRGGFNLGTPKIPEHGMAHSQNDCNPPCDSLGRPKTIDP